MLVLIRHASSTARCSLQLVASIHWQIKFLQTKAYQFHKIIVTSLEIPDFHGLIKHFLYPYEEIIGSSIQKIFGENVISLKFISLFPLTNLQSYINRYSKSQCNFKIRSINYLFHIPFLTLAPPLS
jgi:hypothetical protein